MDQIQEDLRELRNDTALGVQGASAPEAQPQVGSEDTELIKLIETQLSSEPNLSKLYNDFRKQKGKKRKLSHLQTVLTLADMRRAMTGKALFLQFIKFNDLRDYAER